MFTITPFAPSRSPAENPQYSKTRHHESVLNDLDDDDMDTDDDENGDSLRITGPGETIASLQTYMRGHGTYVENDLVVSSTAGTIERVNKLISVKSISSRYSPEVGDLVVGRITEVQARRWKVQLGSRQDGILMLASVNLPGGVQRRKLESDELQMRTYFEESDLLVAEVQQINNADGSCALHTRSLRYGKLRNGMLVIVPPVLVKRLQSHFFTLLPLCNVDIILGLNGYVWVSKHEKELQLGEEGFDAQAIYSNKNDDIDSATRRSIVLVSAILRAIASLHIPITDTLLNKAYEHLVLERDVEPGEDDKLRDQLSLAVSAWL